MIEMITLNNLVRIYRFTIYFIRSLSLNNSVAIEHVSIDDNIKDSALVAYVISNMKVVMLYIVTHKLGNFLRGII